MQDVQPADTSEYCLISLTFLPFSVMNRDHIPKDEDQCLKRK